MSINSIRVQNLTKSYQLYNKNIDRLKEILFPFKKYFNEFFALKNISFEASKGDVIGIIGNNGAGKSTLLKILTGVVTASEGIVEVKGKVASLLELGAGFNPEYNGIENIYLQGTLMGYTRVQMKNKIDEIIEFADIGEFINQPVHMYSSGMFARLAFAVAVHSKPEILIIDEALSVGDSTFSHKSFNKIMQLKELGTTIVFCSHSLYQVEMICSKVLWLHKGEMLSFGKTSDVIKEYEAFTYANDLNKDVSVTKKVQKKEIQNGMNFTKVAVSIDDNEASYTTLVVGKSRESTIKVQLSWRQNIQLPPPSVGITINTIDGRIISSAATHFDHISTKCNKDGVGSIEVIFDSIALLKGIYKIEAYLMCEKGVLFYDQIYTVAQFKIVQNDDDFEQGIVHLSRIWRDER